MSSSFRSQLNDLISMSRSVLYCAYLIYLIDRVNNKASIKFGGLEDCL